MQEFFHQQYWGGDLQKMCVFLGLPALEESDQRFKDLGPTWTNHSSVTLPKTNMTMENPSFEDVFPMENGDFPASHVSFQGCNFLEHGEFHGVRIQFLSLLRVFLIRICTNSEGISRNWKFWGTFFLVFQAFSYGLVCHPWVGVPSLGWCAIFGLVCHLWVGVPSLGWCTK